MATASESLVPTLWDEALDKVTEQDRHSLAELEGEEDAEMEGDLLERIEFIKSLVTIQRWKCEENRWKFKLNNRTIILRDVAMRIITVLEKFASVGDSIAQWDTAHLSLPWAGIRFLIVAGVATRDEASNTLSLLDMISSVATRGRVLEKTYLDDTVPNEPGLIRNMRQALVKLYTSVLTALASSYRHVRRNPLSQAAVVILDPERTRKYLANISECEIEVKNLAQVCQGRQMAISNDQITTKLDSLHQTLKLLENPLQRIDDGLSNFMEFITDNHREEILNWISDIKFGNPQESKRTERADGTCDWLIRHSKFVEWETDSSSRILWLKGSLGTGKSVAVSRIIDHLKDRFSAEVTDDAFAYFYCSRNFQGSHDRDQVLRSILKQLIRPICKEAEVSTAARNLYHQHLDNGTDLSFSTCKKIIPQLAAKYPRTTIILDGLDECIRQERRLILEFLVGLVEQSERPLKIFIASREDVHIKKKLDEHQDVDTIEIKADQNHDDITVFVRERIESMTDWSTDLQDEVVKALCPKERHEGMFLWASLHIQQLAAVILPSTVRKELQNIPKDLVSTYQKIYDQISKHSFDNDRIKTERLLQWIICSSMPLTTKELQFAVSQDCSQQYLSMPDTSDITENTLLQVSHHLVVMDSNLGGWRLCHYSVREFLENRYQDLYGGVRANNVAANTCLKTVLGKKDSREPSEKWERNESYSAFKEYAIWSWPYHSRFCGDENRDLMEEFLEPAQSGPQSELCYRQWVIHIQRVQPPTRFVHWTLSKTSMGLFAPIDESSFGLCILGVPSPLAWRREAKTLDYKIRNTAGWSLLSLAIFHGHRPAWQTLLEGYSTSDLIENEFSDWESPWCTAVATSLEATQDLLKKGASADEFFGPRIGTPLSIAVIQSEVETMELLIKSGANVNKPLDDPLWKYSEAQARDPALYDDRPMLHTGSALATAAYRGNAVAVKKLIDYGAEINQDIPGRYGSALAAAATRGSLEVVNLLIDHGAEVDMLLPRAKFGNALTAAAGTWDSNLKVVQRLIDAGAEVNMPLPSWPGSPLAAAASCEKAQGEKAIYAVQRGLADIFAVARLSDTRFGSVLQETVSGIAPTVKKNTQFGDVKVVRLLLENGAEPTMPLNGLYEDALDAARQTGSWEVLQLMEDWIPKD